MMIFRFSLGMSRGFLNFCLKTKDYPETKLYVLCYNNNVVEKRVNANLFSKQRV